MLMQTVTYTDINTKITLHKNVTYYILYNNDLDETNDILLKRFHKSVTGSVCPAPKVVGLSFVSLYNMVSLTFFINDKHDQSRL